ncbi:OST5 family protein [Vibrio pelagius]|uniref:OST5 family protein n=1 Tax=Vibrio pelagius TaxID=28169 RepID=UPI0021C3A537|nr:OST5 family protein [Vibrio pelagius]
MFKVLVFLIPLLFVFIVFGLGVAFGGGEQLETGNTINIVIALGTVSSALVGFGTLFLLIAFRHDWRMPKIDESRLELIRGLKRWERAIKQNIEIPSNYNPSVPDFHVIKHEIDDLLQVETRLWQTLESSFDTLIYYDDKFKPLENQFNEIVQYRADSFNKLKGYRNAVNASPLSPYNNSTVYTLGIQHQKRKLARVSEVLEHITSRL